METVFVLSADNWELTDERTGEIRRGVTITYVNNYREPSERSLGLRPTKAPATYEVFELIKKGGVPGFYRLDFRTRPGKEAKPVLTVSGAEFVRKLELFAESEPTFVKQKAR